MTDITKYKNVSLSHKTYDLIDKNKKSNTTRYGFK